MILAILSITSSPQRQVGTSPNYLEPSLLKEKLLVHISHELCNIPSEYYEFKKNKIEINH